MQYSSSSADTLSEANLLEKDASADLTKNISTPKLPSAEPHGQVKSPFRQPDVESVSISTRHVILLLVVYLAKLYEWTVLGFPFRPLHFDLLNCQAADAMLLQANVVRILLLELVRPEYGLFTYVPETDTYNVCVQHLPLPYWKIELYQLFAHLLYTAFIAEITLPFHLSIVFWKNLVGECVTQEDFCESDPMTRQRVVHYSLSARDEDVERLNLHFNAECDGLSRADQRHFWDARVAQAVEAGRDVVSADLNDLVYRWLLHKGEQDANKSVFTLDKKFVALSHQIDADKPVETLAELTYYHTLHNDFHMKTGRADVMKILRQPFLDGQLAGEESHDTPCTLLPLSHLDLMTLLENHYQHSHMHSIPFILGSARDPVTDEPFYQAIQRCSTREKRRLSQWIGNSWMMAEFFHQNSRAVTFKVFFEECTDKHSRYKRKAIICRLFRNTLQPDFSDDNSQIEIAIL